MCSKNKSAGCYLRCKWINGGYEISKASHYVLLVSFVDTHIHRLYLGPKKMKYTDMFMKTITGWRYWEWSLFCQDFRGFLFVKVCIDCLKTQEQVRLNKVNQNNKGCPLSCRTKVNKGVKIQREKKTDWRGSAQATKRCCMIPTTGHSGKGKLWRR